MFREIFITSRGRYATHFNDQITIIALGTNGKGIEENCIACEAPIDTVNNTYGACHDERNHIETVDMECGFCKEITTIDICRKTGEVFNKREG